MLSGLSGATVNPVGGSFFISANSCKKGGSDVTSLLYLSYSFRCHFDNNVILV